MHIGGVFHVRFSSYEVKSVTGVQTLEEVVYGLLQANAFEKKHCCLPRLWESNRAGSVILPWLTYYKPNL